MSKKPVWPLNAPGMPLPGIDFLNAAKALGGHYEADKKTLKAYSPRVEEVVRRCLYDGGQFTLNMTIKEGQKKPMIVISGHKWGRNPDGVSAGPEPCDVMVIGKMLGDVEINYGRCLRGPTGKHLIEALQKLGIEGIGKWYVTNALKTENPDLSATSLKAGWLNGFAHLLHQEIRLVKPKFILCLGSDAVKMLLGKGMTIEKMRGRIMELEVPCHKSEADEPEYMNIKVMAAEHPAAVLRNPEKQDRFELDLARFGKLLTGDRWDKNEPDLDHRLVTNELQLRKVIKEAEANNKSRIVAVDAEWHGQHPQNKGAYLRCLQFSWKHKAAACVCLHKAGGIPSFKVLVRDKNGHPLKKDGKFVWTTKGGQRVAFRMLRRYFEKKRVVGHFFNADLEWLVYHGLDLRPQFAAPRNWMKCRTHGGWDTGLMAHALDETGTFNLTDQALRYTKAPRYDIALDNWRDKYCRENELKAGQLEGYGECPDEILYPYALYDADVTRRLAIRHAKSLTCDRYGNNCWEAFWVSQRATMAVFEINTTGIPVDRKRLDKLTTIYMAERDKLNTEICRLFAWPTLKLNSHDQIRELLFGERYGKRDEKGQVIRLRPPGAKSLQVMPAITTDKRPKEWEKVIEEGKERDHTASTNKMALGILLREAEKMRVFKKGKWIHKNYKKPIQMIRDYRFVNQVLQSVLRKPMAAADEESGDPFETDDDGNFMYEAGLPGAICSDDRVRTFISQVKETGRWSSSRPPLQNLSKRREPDYARILGDAYEYPLRSIFTAEPGCVLIEADYVGAELFGMAIMSGDPQMIDHAIRNQLPEDDANFYDIHSNIAVLAFGYTCEATKKGLKGIGMEHMRIVAKSVVFGVAYGRGAKAIALAAREEGVTVSVDDAQKVIDTIFRMYPRLVPFFEECRARAVTTDPKNPSPRWLCGPFGRFRRFSMTTERDVMGEYERQAMNFPIQGMIADAVSRAVDHLITYRDKHKMKFKLVLQVHDALVLMVPFDEVATVINKVLPTCMSKKVPIYPCHLDGTPREEVEKPYHLGIDVEIAHNWGVHMMPHECWEREIDEKFAGWKSSKSFKKGWACNYFPKKVWLERTQRLHPTLTDKAKVELLKEDVIKAAIRMHKLPKDTDVMKATKKMKDDDLLKLVTNDDGKFVSQVTQAL